MTEFLTEHVSYLGIFIFLVLTGMGFPLPEEVPVVVAGVASSYGELNPWIAFATCWAGALCGDCVMYSIGYFLGYGFLKDHPKFARIFHADRYLQVLQMFEKHGLKVLFVARFLVGIRGPVYLASGMLRIPFRKFIFVDLFSATAVVGLFFGLSYKYGQHVTEWVKKGEIALTLIVGGGMLVGGYWYYRRWRKKKSENIPGAGGKGIEHPAGDGSPLSDDQDSSVRKKTVA